MKRRYKWLLGVGGFFAVLIAGLMITLAWTSPCPPVASGAAGADSMIAVTQRCYGPPSVLRAERLAKPQPSDHEVLIKVHVASVNPYEWHMTTGKPYLIRALKGIGAPKGHGVGNDFAGTIEAVGSKVTRFKPGDEVFGGASGALAQYALAPEDGDIVLKPANVSFEQAAATPIAAVTALQALKDRGQLKAGQKVLINGASGGVGTYAVQIAKALGAEVTAVCSTRNVEMVRSLGADHVIDYTREDFTKGAARYDLIVDNVGNHGFLALADALTPTGRLVTVSGPKDNAFLGPLPRQLRGVLLSRFIDKHVEFFVADVDAPDLTDIARLMSDGKVRSVIDRHYPLEQTAQALEYIGTRRAQGKVLVTIP